MCLLSPPQSSQGLTVHDGKKTAPMMDDESLQYASFFFFDLLDAPPPSAMITIFYTCSSLSLSLQRMKTGFYIYFSSTVR